MAANNEPILKRLEHLVPSVDAIARALQVEHETAVRLHRLALLRHAVLIELQEQASQSVTASEETHADLVEISEAAKKTVEDVVELREQAQRVVIDAVELSEAAKKAVVDSGDVHGDLVGLAEQASQAVLNSTDSIHAEADLISQQRVNMGEMEKFADTQAGAATIAANIGKVQMVYDEISIAQVLNDAYLPAVTKAGKLMTLIRITEWIDALMDATEGR